MPGDELKLNLRLTADGEGFVGEVRVAKRELDKLTGSAGKSSRAADKQARSFRGGKAATRVAALPSAAAGNDEIKITTK